MTILRRDQHAFSLLEMLIALVILSTIVAVVIPYTSPAREEQLRAAGRIVAAEIDYARNLAINYNSSYKVTFDAANSRLVIEHAGTDTALDDLPSTPFRSPQDPADEHRVPLAGMAGISETIALSRSYQESDPLAAVVDVEFGPLGETTRSEATWLWLTAGAGTSARYLPVTIHPVTGLTTVGELRSAAPPLLYTSTIENSDPQP